MRSNLPLGRSFTEWLPSQTLRFTEANLCDLLKVVVDRFLAHTNDVLPFPVLDHVQVVKGGQDVFGLEAGHSTDLLNGYIGDGLFIIEDLHEHEGPVGAVADLS